MNAIVQDSTGAMWFFGHHSDSLIVSRYDGIIREITKTQVKWNLIMSPPAVVDGKGRFWMRAHPLYERRSGSYPGTASLSIPIIAGITTQLKQDSSTTVFTT